MTTTAPKPATGYSLPFGSFLSKVSNHSSNQSSSFSFLSFLFRLFTSLFTFLSLSFCGLFLDLFPGEEYVVEDTTDKARPQSKVFTKSSKSCPFPLTRPMLLTVYSNTACLSTFQYICAHQMAHCMTETLPGRLISSLVMPALWFLFFSSTS